MQLASYFFAVLLGRIDSDGDVPALNLYIGLEITVDLALSISINTLLWH